MRYWTDLFTWKTWQEFIKAGGNVSGFRERRWSTVQKINPGDYLLCYLTGLSRFIGILEVTGSPYKDTSPIWGEAIFPSRVPVKILVSLPPEQAVPVITLKSELSYFQNMKSPYSWSGHFRGSPTEEKSQDAKAIISALEEALRNPTVRTFDKRKLDRKVPVYYETEAGIVTVPDNNERSRPVETDRDVDFAVSHEEIQWQLLSLGSEMGFDVWVASNDRGKSYQGQSFQSIQRLRKTLPRQFNEATQRTIELIDVLWLGENDSIVAAFEIEHTTSIYSGLLRLSDLVAMQPNINIDLYIVAPDERRDKVFSEISRPTFTNLRPPLREICRFIPYSSLQRRLEQIGTLRRYLRPEFLDEVAEVVETVDI